MYESLIAHGIRPIVTDVRDADTGAIEAAAGRLMNRAEKLH